MSPGTTPPPSSAPATAPTPAPTTAREQRREALLDDLVAVVRSGGAFVTMEQLAAGCGVTKPILYRHFDGRDGLVHAIAERFVSQLADALDPALRNEDPAVERLRAAIDAYLALLEREPDLYRFLSTHVGGDRDVLAGMVAEHVALVLESLLATRATDADAARAWAYGLVGMVHLAGDWWIANRPYPRSTLVDHLTDLLGHGLIGLGLDQPQEPR